MDIGRNQGSNDDEELHDVHQNAGSRLARSQRRRLSSSMKRRNDEREMMINQAKTFRDFEHLFTAFGALEDWKGLADKAKK